MKNFSKEERIVLTLDAGGTNFNFSALKSGRQYTKSFILPAFADNRERCLKTLISGFKRLQESLCPEVAEAISFAFPGPADYKNGIIGDVINFSGFRGGVAIGPMLENEFKLPVIINNDGNLFAYGESIGGFLKFINDSLAQRNLKKRYNNLIGITLGTGFGAGIVINNQIYNGENSSAGEIWLTRNHLSRELIAEEGVSARAIQKTYMRLTNNKKKLTPKEIYLIANGNLDGNRSAAIRAFKDMGTVIGESLANALTLIDAPVVIGGGISGAADIIIPRILKHLKSPIKNDSNKIFQRIIPKTYFINDEMNVDQFIEQSDINVEVPFSNKKVRYEQTKKIPLGISRLGTSEAICLGAYKTAIDFLDKKPYYP